MSVLKGQRQSVRGACVYIDSFNIMGFATESWEILLLLNYSCLCAGVLEGEWTFLEICTQNMATSNPEFKERDSAGDDNSVCHLIGNRVW